jgi:hypothetical protein
MGADWPPHSAPVYKRRIRTFVFIVMGSLNSNLLAIAFSSAPGNGPVRGYDPP